MKSSPESRRISSLLKSLREGALVPRPPFQRRAVWTNKDKVEFIVTILMEYPFPEIYIAASTVDTITGDATEVLVDGQQRIGAIEDYFKAVPPFKNPKSIPKYADLEEEEKRRFLNYEVAVRNLGLLDDLTIREVFKRMNRTSYDLNEMERYNAVYLGEFKQFCERISEHDFFAKHKLFSANDIRRMRDVAYVASLTATMLSTYFHRDDEIEEYLDMYNEKFEKRDVVFSRYRKVFEFIDDLQIPTESRAWRKVDFYTLFIESDRQIYRKNRLPITGKLRPHLLKLYESVEKYREAPFGNENVREYFEATLRNTNDRSSRIARGKVVEKLFDSVAAKEYELEIVPFPYVAASDEAFDESQESLR